MCFKKTILLILVPSLMFTQVAREDNQVQNLFILYPVRSVLLLFVSNSAIPEMEYIYLLAFILKTQLTLSVWKCKWKYAHSKLVLLYLHKENLLPVCIAAVSVLQLVGSSLPQKGGIHKIMFTDKEYLVTARS